MSVMRYTGGAWVGIAGRKQYSGGRWVDLERGRRRTDEDTWSYVWNNSQLYTLTLSSTNVYSYSNSRYVSSFMYVDYFILGTRNDDQYSALVFFDNSNVAQTLSGATIVSVEAYLTRTDISTGVNSGRALLCYSTEEITSRPTVWDGSNAIKAVDTWPVFTRGEAKWVALKPEVGQALQNGTFTCLCFLDEDENATDEQICIDKAINLRVKYRY